MNSRTTLIVLNAAAPHSGIFMFCAMPSFCGSICVVAMGQMLRHRPGAIVTRAGATGISRFHIKARPTAGQNNNRPTSTTPMTNIAACRPTQTRRASGVTVRLLAAEPELYLVGATRTSMVARRDDA